jgi:hypothetical protein
MIYKVSTFVPVITFQDSEENCKSLKGSYIDLITYKISNKRKENGMKTIISKDYFDR